VEGCRPVSRGLMLELVTEVKITFTPAKVKFELQNIVFATELQQWN
jgi:hypothetical protein